MKKDSRIRRILENKENWLSLINIILVLVCALVGFFAPDDKISGKAISLALGLLALEFFMLVVVHLESIQGALRQITNSTAKGVQITEWEDNINQLIGDTTNELFFSGNNMSRLPLHHEKLLSVPDNIKVRLLVANLDDSTVLQNVTTTFGKPVVYDSLNHLKCFTPKPNIEIRTVNFPMTTYIAARDTEAAFGEIQVGFHHYMSSGYDVPNINLTRTDTGWYGFYIKQIELLWEQGIPWPPEQS